MRGVGTRCPLTCWSGSLTRPHRRFLYFLCFHSDEEELRKSFSELGDSLCDSNASKSTKQVGSDERPLPVGSEPSGALLYKNGFLVRKVHADSDGKRSTEQTFLTLYR